MQRPLLVTLGALSLISACSSGDGFNEDRNDNNNGGGSAPSAQITSGNAAQVTKVSYQSAQTADAAANYSGGTGFIAPVTSPVAKIDGSFGTAGKASADTASIPIPPTTESCPASGTSTLSGDIADPLTPTLTPGDYFDLTYVNCGDDFAVLDGNLYYEVDAFAGELLSGSYDLTMSTTFTDFQIATDEDTLLSNGDVVVRLNTLDLPVVTAEVTGSSLTVDSDLGTQTLTNFASSFEQNSSSVPAPYTQASSGTLNTTLIEGVVSYSTPVDFAGFDAEYPNSGEFLVAGENSSARLVVLDSVNISIEVDTDGDGVVDDTIEMTWAEFEAL
jgi:hypothetical protein